MPEKILILDINLKEPADPLQEQTHRGNLYRTGVNYTQGVAKTPKVAWKKQVGNLTPDSPLCYEDTVYIGGSDSFFHAFDAQTGEERWKFQMAGPPLISGKQQAVGYYSPCSPTAPTIKERILYTGGGQYVYALDIRTGRPKWKTTIRRVQYIHGSPLPVYGAVFVQMGGITAIHAETGQVLTVYPNWFWGAFTSMSFAQGTVYATGDSGLSWVDMRSGSRGGSPNTFPDYCIPVVYNDRILSAAVRFVAVDMRSGNHIYQSPVADGPALGLTDEAAIAGRCDAQIAVWQDMVFMSTRDGYCRAFDANKGSKLWKTQLSGRSQASVSVSTLSGKKSDDTIVYTGCDDGTVWALNASDGKVLWSLKVADGKIVGDPWIADGTVYVTSNDGYLYAIR